jgi:hypothetical protein
MFEQLSILGTDSNDALVFLGGLLGVPKVTEQPASSLAAQPYGYLWRLIAVNSERSAAGISCSESIRQWLGLSAVERLFSGPAGTGISRAVA